MCAPYKQGVVAAEGGAAKVSTKDRERSDLLVLRVLSLQAHCWHITLLSCECVVIILHVLAGYLKKNPEL